MKSNLHAVYNDPKLNRFKETTRIQPLFKKKFDSDAISASLPAASGEPQRNKSTANLHLDPLQNRLPPTGASRSQEDLYLVLQKLKAEKLEVMRDLYTYEGRYDKKLSLRARLTEMNGLCKELHEMAESAQGQVGTEQLLYEKLLLGLQTFTLKKMQQSKKRLKAYEDTAPSGAPEGSFQESRLVSGLRTLVRGQKLAEEVELVVHLEVAQSTFRIRLPLPNTAKREKEEQFRRQISAATLPRLFFTCSNAKLSLQYDAHYGSNWLYFIIKLKGSPFPYNCIKLTVSAEKVQIVMREQSISVSDLQLTITHSDLGIEGGLGSLSETTQEKVLRRITEQLSLMDDEQGGSRLEWGMNEWQIEHGLYRTREDSRSISITPLPPKRPVKQKYEEFNIAIHTERLKVKNYDLEVSLHFSTIVETYRIQVKYGAWTCSFAEEEFVEEFAFLRSLQFSSVQIQPKTLFRSVEFQMVIQQLLNI